MAGEQPLVAVDAAELRIEKRPFEMNPEQRAPRTPCSSICCAASTISAAACSIDSNGAVMTPATKPVAPHARVFAGGDGDGVALIAIEQRVGSAVGVDVDQTGRDGRARGTATVPRSVGGKNGGDAAILDGQASEGRSPVADGDECWGENR